MHTSLSGAQCGTVSGEYCHPLRDKLVALDAAGSSGKGPLPTSLQSITTSLKLEYWQQQLSSHPDQTFTQMILKGIEQGFRVGFDNQTSQLRSKGGSLLSTRSHPEVVSDYIATELRIARVDPEQAGGVHTSPFGVIPKKHKPNKWRLILDLSSPEGFSVNDQRDQ